MAKSMQTDLGNAPLGKLMLRLAIPGVTAQLVNLLYTMVDRIYIGHIPGEGALALTGLGLCTPVVLLVSAFSGFVGQGGAPRAAMALGRRDRQEAEQVLGSGVTLLLMFSLVLTVGFLLGKEPILYLFGASDDTISYANAYLGIYLLGTVFVQLSLGLNSFISCQGQARIAMLSVLIGAVTNIVLDPVFIFVFKMGVQGAALATVLSQALSAFWILRFLTSERSAIRLRPGNIRWHKPTVAAIAALGISPFIMQSTECLIAAVFNSQLQRWGGDLYVGSMTVLNSVSQMIFVSTHGFTYGVQPILSYNFGAGNLARVRRCFKIMASVTIGIMCLFTAAAMIFPTAFARVFTDDEALIALVGQVMPLFLSATGVFGIQTSVQCSFLALGKARQSFFLACLRKIILLTPLAFILPHVMGGVMGVYWAEPISDFISAVTAAFLFLPVYRNLDRKNPKDL